MPKLVKRPIVIQDLIAVASYISADNLEAGDRYKKMDGAISSDVSTKIGFIDRL